MDTLSLQPIMIGNSKSISRQPDLSVIKEDNSHYSSHINSPHHFMPEQVNSHNEHLIRNKTKKKLDEIMEHM